MTDLLLAILARGSDDDDKGWMKLIPFVVIAAIWLLGVIASAMGKAKKANPGPSWQPAPPAGPPARAPPPILRTIGPMPPAQPVYLPPSSRPPQPPRQMPAKAPRRRAVAPPPVPLVIPEPPPSRAQRAQRAKPAPERPAAAPAGLSAASIRRWLTPRVMRQQYIVTEVFDPPAALRDDDADRGRP